MTVTDPAALDGLDEKSSNLVQDWLLRDYTPTWLEAAGLTKAAQELRDLPEITDKATEQAAIEAAIAAKQAAYAAWDVFRTEPRDTDADDRAAEAWEATQKSGIATPGTPLGDAARAAAWYTAADAAWVTAAMPSDTMAREAFRENGWQDRPEEKAAAEQALDLTATLVQDSVKDLIDKVADLPGGTPDTVKDAGVLPPVLDPGTVKDGTVKDGTGEDTGTSTNPPETKESLTRATKEN